MKRVGEEKAQEVLSAYVFFVFNQCQLATKKEEQC